MFPLTVLRQFRCCRFSFLAVCDFIYGVVFFFFPYLFFISPSFGASGGLGVMMVAFPVYIEFCFCYLQTYWCYISLEWPIYFIAVWWLQTILFTPTWYNDKIHYNENLTVKKPSLENYQIVTNNARIFHFLLRNVLDICWIASIRRF